LFQRPHAAGDTARGRHAFLRRVAARASRSIATPPLAAPRSRHGAALCAWRRWRPHFDPGRRSRNGAASRNRGGHPTGAHAHAHARARMGKAGERTAPLAGGALEPIPEWPARPDCLVGFVKTDRLALAAGRGTVSGRAAGPTLATAARGPFAEILRSGSSEL